VRLRWEATTHTTNQDNLHDKKLASSRITSVDETMKLVGFGGGSGRHDDVSLTAQSHLAALSRDVRRRTMFFTLTPLVGAKD
jgi:hypothetical protein